MQAVTVINELVTAYKKKPEEVTDWLGDENQEITRGSVKLLRDFLEDKRKHGAGSAFQRPTAMHMAVTNLPAALDIAGKQMAPKSSPDRGAGCVHMRRSG